MKKLLLLFIFIGSVASAQMRTVNPTGANLVMSPNVTLINNSTTETSLLSLPDTLKANTLVAKPYRFLLFCQITTPAISIPTLTIRVKLGSQVLTLFNGISLLGSQTTQPFLIEGFIFPTGSNTQIVWCRINQTPGTALTLSSTNTALIANWNANTSVSNNFNITAQWGGFTLGTAVLTSSVFYRFDY